MSKVPLPGSEHTEPAQARRVGAPAADQRLPVAIVLRQPTPATFDADPRDITVVEEFARQQNLTIDAVFPERRMVDLSGSVTQMEQAFNVELVLFEYRGEQYVSHSGPVYLPAELVPAVLAVFGLNTVPIFPDSGSAGPNQVVNDLIATLGAYNFPTGLDGTGQTVGIVALGGGYEQSDLDDFFGGLDYAVPSLVQVSADNVTGNSPGNDDMRDREITQDICILGAIAPLCTIVLYWADPHYMGMLRAVSCAVKDTVNLPSVISISYSDPEMVGPSLAETMAIDGYLLQAKAQVISVFAASGDKGSTAGEAAGQHVRFPASSPNVTACGGTTLTIAGGAVGSETVWNDPEVESSPGEQGKPGITGGGVSQVFALPAFQVGAGIPANPDQPPYVNPQVGPAGRGVPDVASHADGFFGMFQGGQAFMNGTSAAAPLWAGLITLINQLRGVPTGYFNDVLYGRLVPAGALRDVTAPGTNGYWPAGPGWDACTGWGSPNGGSIANLIGPPTVISVQPPGGPLGGTTPVAIGGQFFLGALPPTVTFDGVGVPAKNITVVDDNNLTVISPPAATASTVDVVVTTMQGSSGKTSNSKFNYFFPTPVVSDVEPHNGAATDEVVVTGTGFTGVTGVSFGDATSPEVVPDPNTPDTRLTVSAPSGVSGDVHVTVTTADTSAPTDNDLFTYQ
jgi:kumamolisin